MGIGTEPGGHQLATYYPFLPPTYIHKLQPKYTPSYAAKQGQQAPKTLARVPPREVTDLLPGAHPLALLRRIRYGEFLSKVNRSASRAPSQGATPFVPVPRAVAHRFEFPSRPHPATPWASAPAPHS